MGVEGGGEQAGRNKIHIMKAFLRETISRIFWTIVWLILGRVRMPAARAGARESVPISELVFGTLTQNRNSLELSLGFAGQPRLHSPSPGHPRCEDRWSSDIAATSAATHRPAGVRPSPDRQRIEEPGAHGLTRRVSNEVPRDFGCTSWASGAGPPRGSDGFSHGETRRLPEARWQRRVVVRPQDYSGFG